MGWTPWNASVPAYLMLRVKWWLSSCITTLPPRGHILHHTFDCTLWMREWTLVLPFPLLDKYLTRCLNAWLWILWSEYSLFRATKMRRTNASLGQWRTRWILLGGARDCPVYLPIPVPSMTFRCSGGIGPDFDGSQTTYYATHGEKKDPEGTLGNPRHRDAKYLPIRRQYSEHGSWNLYQYIITSFIEKLNQRLLIRYISPIECCNIYVLEEKHNA